MELTSVQAQTRLLDVHIEYCSSCGFRDQADEVQAALQAEFGGKLPIAPLRVRACLWF